MTFDSSYNFQSLTWKSNQWKFLENKQRGWTGYFVAAILLPSTLYQLYTRHFKYSVHSIFMVNLQRRHYYYFVGGKTLLLLKISDTSSKNTGLWFEPGQSDLKTLSTPNMTVSLLEAIQTEQLLSVSGTVWWEFTSLAALHPIFILVR